MPTLIFNGKTYTDPNEMPPEVRQAYEQAQSLLADKNRNGLPDIMEGLVTAPDPQAAPTAFVTQKIMVAGKVYDSPDELPPELRQKYTQAMAKMGVAFGDANQNGMPDFMEGQGPTNVVPPPTATSSAPPPTTVIGDPAPNRVGLVMLLGGLGILAIFCVFGVWFLLPMFK